MEDLAVVILAGGSGTRFWPASTASRPKQFLKLLGQRSLFEDCVDRALALAPAERILVLTNEIQKPLVRDQAGALPPENVICEPCRRDTAAAVALGAALCRKLFGDPVTAVFPSDHAISPLDLFRRTVLSAAAAAGGGALYTLGIRPSRPETGYGYLELGEQTLDDGGIRHYRLLRFKEKPDLKAARRYVGSGRFLWNSGMFVWRTSAVLARIESFLPGHLEAVSRAVESFGGRKWRAALRSAFEPLKPVSIDYGVMEKAPDVRTAAAEFSWNDVGGWPALEGILPRDADGNSANCVVHSLDSSGNVVFCEGGGRSVALVGVKDLVVVDAGGRILVVPKARAQDVKKLVEGIGKD